MSGPLLTTRGEPRHGDVRKYHAGCRCGPCLTAKEQQRQYDRQRYLANREATIKRATLYQKTRDRTGYRGVGDPEVVRARSRKWYQENKSRAAERTRSYRQTEAGRLSHQLSNALRRARERGAPGFCTPAQAKARVDFFGGMCSYCRERPFEHFDHAIPISRGGTNWPANLRPACSSCNLHKWTKTWREFLAA